MQVKITRGTGSKGMISKKLTYTLTVIAQPTEEEARLIQKWGGGSLHAGRTVSDFGDEGKPLYQTTFSSLLSGYQWEDESMKRILTMEEHVLETCANVLNWCETAETFGTNAESIHQVTSAGVSD